MGLIFYNIFLWFYRLAAQVASWFDPKAKQWVRGRKNILRDLEKKLAGENKIVWIHCASLGEFEQGRPVIEGIKQLYPGYRVLLSFFSPSGYEPLKDYPLADWVIYMPLDGPRTAKRFLETVRPSLVVFIKYEFWYYYLKKIKYRDIPLILVSAHFRREMSFFKWHGSLQRKMLSRFDHLFVQDERSKHLLDEIGLASITTVSGDTRFDRVLKIASAWQPVAGINFPAGTTVLVAGSTWPEDEMLLQKVFARFNNKDFILLIAPHEIDTKHINNLLELFPGGVLYSSLDQSKSFNTGVLIINTIGLLSRLYRLGDFCYVGGGQTSRGIHNVLEAAVYYKPVFIGPHFTKYREAVQLVECGGAVSVKNEVELFQNLETMLSEPAELKKRGMAAGTFVRTNAGATQKILDYIQAKRLLTS